MAAEKKLTFRTDSELQEALEAFAVEAGEPNLSRIVRVLLRQALGEKKSRSAAVEAVFEFQAIKTKVVRSLSAEMIEQIPAILEREIGAMG